MNQENLEQFAQQNHLQGLTLASIRAVAERRSGYSVETARRFLHFQRRIEHELLDHPVITDNHYCQWFESGQQNEAQLKDFVVQFSVFSNRFLLAQLLKMINADTLKSMRASKEILANEIGVIFNPGRPVARLSGAPELVATEGSVEGGQFRFKAAHFEWLLRMAQKLGLRYDEIGKRRHGTPATLFFCDELVRFYGSEDYMVCQAASYAVENWAAAGFWDQLVKGFERYNTKHHVYLPLGFFSWHAKIEAQHAAHTKEELEDLYFSRPIDEDDYIHYGNEMLDGVAAFWNGLDERRLALQ